MSMMIEVAKRHLKGGVFLTKTVILSLILLVFNGCTEPATVSQPSNVDMQTKTEAISKARAKEISDQAIKGELNFEFYEVIVHDRSDNWVVEYVIKDDFKHRTGGGGAIVEISKESGHIKSSYIGK